MATDKYKKINAKSRINLRSIRDQRGDKTHFVYELVQNADDSKSKRLELHLCEKELLVWNDGCKFREEDVLRISSIGFSDKDLTQIGNFGEGFKAVYNYTDRPEVYSGDERFCLPDPTSTSKTLEDFASSSLVEGIDKVPPRIAELVEEGKTVFRLPFKEDLRQEDLTLLKGQLRKLLKKRSLLFLPHLETIQWHHIRDGQTGTYQRYLPGKIQSADHVELKASINGKDPESERFLVFSKKVQPPRGVIDELLQIEHDQERRKRIQETGKKLQPIEIAFKLQDDRITAMNNCVLSAYLPTEKETHLRFFIQARYQTNPARNDIEKTEQNPWNRWLVEETAKFLPEILGELKEAGWLEPVFFDVLPLEGEVENDFKPIAEDAKKAMRERALIPTEKKGHYAKAENVFYPHHGTLRKLIECSWIYPSSCWLHSDMGQSDRAFDVMKEAGVREITVSQVLDWLQKQDCSWFEDRNEEWLRDLYSYLKEQKSQLERIKKLPLVRLENGQHVRVDLKSVFFPPNTDEVVKEIKSFFKDLPLPIVRSSILEGEERNDIEVFLKSLGVKEWQPVDMILEGICPLYRESTKPTEAENRQHVRYIFKVWSDAKTNEQNRLKNDIRRIPILRAYKSVQREIYDFVVPSNAYLPQAYTGDDDLETYFSVLDGGVWFADDAYLEDGSDPKAWLRFLKWIGSMDTPRIIEESLTINSDNLSELAIRTIEQERTNYDQTVEDFALEYLSEILSKIGALGKVSLSQALWSILVKKISSNKYTRDTFFQGTYHWFYFKDKSKPFDAKFYRQLKETEWLPDENGELQKPDACFVPTDDNRKLLGNSFDYLHPDFDINNEDSKWLADKLGINLNANTDGVLKHLQNLSDGDTEVSVETVERLYRFLDRQDARRSEEFKQDALIFTLNPEPRWWRSDKVFWKDERVVFEEDRGYLKEHYADTLKPFFMALDIAEQASEEHYACRIKEIAETEPAADKKVRERLRKLYDGLTSQTWKWKKIINDDDRCWLGKKRAEWGFFKEKELVLKDHPYIGAIFDGKVPFWAFDDLQVTGGLEVEKCSQAHVEVQPEGEPTEDKDLSEQVRDLRPYIHAFLNSLGEETDDFDDEIPEERRRAEVLRQVSVCRVKRLNVTYTLTDIPGPDQDPRQSFLDVSDPQAKLWLGSELDKSEYPELIADALQEHFRVRDLGRFVEDLLTPTKDRERVLSNWRRRGFDTDIVLSSDESTKDDEDTVSESLEDKLREGSTHNERSITTGEDNSESENLLTSSRDDGTPQSVNEISESGGQMVHEKMETENSKNEPKPSRDRSRPNERSRGRREHTPEDTQAKKEIERIGMERAIKHEKENGRIPKDVSSQRRRGYDIHSTASGGEIRCIEVKARAGREPVVLTRNEWDVAEQTDNYFLYVVLNADTQPKLYTIQNPAGIITPVEREEYVRVESRYEIPLSEIMEHGKLVR